MKVTLDQARRLVVEAIDRTTGVAELAPSQAHGLALAAAVVAADPVPPFDNSAMDGYAVCTSDLSAGPATLTAVMSVAAGDPVPSGLQPGQTARIMTGAPVPDGADAVIPLELVISVDGDQVKLDGPVDSGRHIRRTGDDIATDQEVFPAGERITARHIGVLHSLGMTRVAVHRRPVIGIASTGNELVPPGRPLRPGQIRDSNRAALLAAATEAGAEHMDLGLLPDDPEVVHRTLTEAADRCDLLVTSGGVSVGDHDVTRQSLEQQRQATWMQVAIQPAKPFLLARIGPTVVLGLPGNPVASMVSWELLVRPAIRALQGRTIDDPALLTAALAEDLSGPASDRTRYLRIAIEPGLPPLARVLQQQGSAQMATMARADGLAVIPPGPPPSAADLVSILPLEPR